jgi:hypothetical protein
MTIRPVEDIPIFYTSSTIQLTVDIVTSGDVPDGYIPNDDLMWYFFSTETSDKIGNTTISQTGLLTLGTTGNDGLGWGTAIGCSFNLTGVADEGCRFCWMF